MKYILIWCSGLNIFAMHGPDGSSKTLTEPELRAKVAGNAILTKWLEYTKDHPNVMVEYEMLPS